MGWSGDKVTAVSMDYKVFRLALICLLIGTGITFALAGLGVFSGLANVNSYLGQLAFRTAGSPFQLVLLGGLVGVIIHWLSLFIRKPTPEITDSYASFALWGQGLFTSLGFIGTIMGISVAVAGLPDAMEANEPSQLTDGLSVAFDTTFIGLCAAIALLLLTKAAQLRS